MYSTVPTIAVVRRETRLERLKARWATAKAAAFQLKKGAAHEVAHREVAAGSGDSSVDFALIADALGGAAEYDDEDSAYQQSLQSLLHEIKLDYPLEVIDRSFLANFDFGRCVLVVVIGPDGLVANTAKYVGDLPIIGVNPDPTRNDGILLPFQVDQARSIVRKVLGRKAKSRPVTLAEANTNDGQRMLAFNDFFVGCASHVSARYTLEVGSRYESQSSSGVLISTGAGSTGWMSSLFNMNEGLNNAFGGQPSKRVRLNWEERRLVWIVREPFRSRHSGADIVAGTLDENHELVIGSKMPANGVIFSDGIEEDAIEFGSGTIARFSVSKQVARLVVG